MPLQREFGGFRVKRLAVVEFDAGPELECPGFEVARSRPRERQLRLRYALVVEIGERVEKRGRRGQCGRVVDADLERVETGDIELKADGDAAARLLGAGGGCQ